MIFLITEEQQTELENFKLQRKIELLQNFLENVLLKQYPEICSIKLFPHFDSENNLEFIVYVNLKESNYLGPRLVSYYRIREKVIGNTIEQLFLKNFKKLPSVRFEIGC
jgi:hypothetical protein